jgi:hypothetical protein
MSIPNAVRSIVQAERVINSAGFIFIVTLRAKTESNCAVLW